MYDKNPNNSHMGLSNYGPEKNSHRHEAVMLWLLSNPEKTITQCARELGYTTAWVSILINSDAFRSKFIEYREGYAGGVLSGLTEKLEAIAHTSLDKLMDALDEKDVEANPQFLLKTAETTLKSLGYGAPSHGITINSGAGTTNVQVVDRSMLEQARAKRALLLAPAPKLERTVEEPDAET